MVSQSDPKNALIFALYVFNRSYKNDEGWKKTNSYGINDLPKLAIVANKAYDYLTAKEGAE